MDSFEDLGFGDWKPPVERGSVVTHFERLPVIVHRHQRSPKPLGLPLVLRFNALPDVKKNSEVAVAVNDALEVGIADDGVRCFWALTGCLGGGAGGAIVGGSAADLERLLVDCGRKASPSSRSLYYPLLDSQCWKPCRAVKCCLYTHALLEHTDVTG